MIPAPISDIFPALQFDQPWQLLRPQRLSDPAASISSDEELLHQVMRGEIGPCLCISQTPRCLVVTRRESRMENFARARETLTTEGWPVVVRCSGGSCVPQGPGMLNLAVIHPRPKHWSLEDGYRLLCELLGRLLAGYEIEAEAGEVPGSFCDGRYNLQFAGKKLVGTAQRWAGADRARAVLSHACLLVDLDLPEVTARINQLYRLCNAPQRFDSGACTTLREVQPQPAALNSEALVASVEQRLAALLATTFAL